eukprot:TRINITY_DN23326_c0_g1_i1.p1 TRINITY_DN23326_c0_g1~~TRINITY_DN23326_c0_g1_i1.p1  ORF type:complete len:201 (+),score=100.51 TRINITY_DN23326_c0_g1_i1:85-687(+)
MGNARSAPEDVYRPDPLTREQLEYFMMVTFFDEAQIQYLHKAFSEFDELAEVNGQAHAPKKNLLELTEFGQSPLRDRILELLDAPDLVNFEQFLRCLSIFAPTASKEDKQRFTFRVWDHDNDGFISGDDMMTTLDVIVGGGLEADEKEHVVNSIIEEQRTPINPDGVLSFEAFQKVINDDLVRKLSLQFGKRQSYWGLKL